MAINLKTVDVVSFRDMCPQIPSSRYSTHAFHSYPAQLIPHIPCFFMNSINKSGNALLFDPFCGTGTVLVEAMHNGWDSIGVEINPVAALISKVKTTPLNKRDLEKELKKIERSYNDRKNKFDITDFENIHYWFDDEAINQLAKIKFCIDHIADHDVRDFYKVTFSSMVKSISKADPRIYVPVMPNDGYVKKKYDAWSLFKKKSLDNIKKIQEFTELIGRKNNTCRVFNENILNFKEEHESIDLVITSPPYISAQKYVRSTRLEAYWLDYNKDYQLQVNRNTIGTELVLKDFYSNLQETGFKGLDDFIKKIHAKNPRRAGIVVKYFIDMKKAIEKIYSMMAYSGTFVMIIGNNTIIGQKIKTNEYLTKICNYAGFKIRDVMVDKISSRGLMTKRNATADIINYEWVIVMKKE